MRAGRLGITTDPGRRHRPFARRGRGPAWVVRATIPGLGLVLAACGHSFSGTTLSEQVTNWETSSSPTLSASVSDIQGDIRRIDASKSDPPKPLPAECEVLVTDVLTANQNLPTPDQTLTDLLAKAYADGGDAGHDCDSGASVRQLARSATERATTRRDLIKALARVDQVTAP